MNPGKVGFYKKLRYTKKTKPVYGDNKKLSYWESWIEEIEGCVAHGMTKLEALSNLSKAFETYIQGMIELGYEEAIPVPEITETFGVSVSRASSRLCKPVVKVEKPRNYLYFQSPSYVEVQEASEPSQYTPIVKENKARIQLEGSLT